MIQHIVLVKWKQGITEEDVLAAFAQARCLADIEGVRRVTIGRNRVAAEHGFTHALIVQLEDEQALQSYLEHPTRARYLAEHLEPIREQHIDVDVPVDMALRPEPGRTWEWGIGMGLPPGD